MQSKSLFFKTLLVTAFLAGSVASAKGSFKKVFVVVLENTNYSAAIQQPFLAEFAKRGALLTNMTASTHPSEGNYISMIAGDTFGINKDIKIDLPDANLADLIEAKGMSWKVYAEDYPGNCFQGDSGNYARKHNPFISFTSISTNPKRCRNIVNSDQMDSDLKSGNLPNYSMYAPNLKNDGHDTGVAFADQWLSQKFGALMKDPNFMDQMLFIITFDESGSKASNQVYTAVFGDSVISGASSNQPYTHYSILKTIESAWGLGSLNKKDVTASEINDVLK